MLALFESTVIRSLLSSKVRRILFWKFFAAIVDCNNSQINKLVLVVHGVGDPEPGETLTRFARSIADEAKPLEDHQEVVWLAEKSPDSDYIQTFAAHHRRVQFKDELLQMVEVFWGDQSRVRKGFIGAVLGMFQILFGLRYVAYVAADQIGNPCGWLKQLGLISSRILHGPVLAVTFFLAILTVAVLGTELMWHGSYKGVLWTQIVLGGCCCVGLLTSAIGWQLTSSRVIERFWFWVSVTCLFVAGVMLAKSLLIDARYPEMAFTESIRPGLIWYCRILVVLLGLLWFVEILVLLATAYSWLLSVLQPKTYTPALHVGFLLPALAVGIWGQTLPMIWLSTKKGINSFAELPEFSSVFDEAIPLLGVQLLMMISIAITAAIVVIRYFIWRSKISMANYSSRNPGPRLIIHNSLQYVLAASTAVGVILVLTLGFIQLGGSNYQDYFFGRLLAESNKYAVIVLVPLGGTMALLLPHLRPAFDIILDIVNHFYFRPTNIQDALDDDDEFDINETTFESGRLFFSRRDAIQSRLKRILTHFRDELTHRPGLVIVSHSQGTMVAIEALNDKELGWLRNTFSSITLVTMGTPLNHVYQHYFNHVYPRLNQPFWSQLRKQTDRWINIYRIDDYVGREIDFPKEFEVAVDERGSLQQVAMYSNHPVGPRGHQSYWSDREVIGILQHELFDCKDANASHFTNKAA